MTAWFSRRGGDTGNVQIAIAVVLSAVLTAAVTGPMAYKAMQARAKTASVSAIVAPTTQPAPVETIAATTVPTTQPATTTTTLATTTTSSTTTTPTTTSPKPAPTTTRPGPVTTRPAPTTTTAPAPQTTTTTTQPACPSNSLPRGLHQVSTNFDENQFTIIRSNDNIQPLVGPNYLVVGDNPKASSTDIFLDDTTMQGQPFRTIGPCDYGSVIAPETGKNINFFSRETLGLSLGKHTITLRYNGAAPDVLTSVITLK